MRAKIVMTGIYVPPKVETSAELARRINRSEEWILTRTGVARRHIAEEPMEVMGAHAAREALAGGPVPDLILNASTTPRQLIPDSSVYIQEQLKLKGVPGYTVHATCLSFIVALHVAMSHVTSGAYRRVLIVSSEWGTISRDFKEPESAALLGDGAAAAVVEPTPDGEDSALLSFRMQTWPKGAPLTELRGGGVRCHPNNPNTSPEDNLFHMDGPAVYKMARRQGALVIREALKDAEMNVDDVDLLIPHQASIGALNSITRYGFPKEKIVNIIREYGNCIAASVPMALAVAHQEGLMKRGDRILIGGTGAGLSAAVCLLQW